MRIFCYCFLASVRKYVYLCIVIKKQSIKLLNYKGYEYYIKEHYERGND
nr:MAG TPA: hypothetical protein [Caudoviricetes sp.]